MIHDAYKNETKQKTKLLDAFKSATIFIKKIDIDFFNEGIVQKMANANANAPKNMFLASP